MKFSLTLNHHICKPEKRDSYDLMKTLAFIIEIIFSLPHLSSAQEDSLKRSTIYKTWITLGGGREIKGTIYQIRDSSILFANTFNKTDFLNGRCDIQNINYNGIYLVTCRKELWPGAVVGMVAGAITGAILGKNIGKSDDPMADYRPLGSFMLGAAFVLPGAIVGIVVTDAAFSLSIPISGNFENYNKNKSRLKNFSYLH